MLHPELRRKLGNDNVAAVAKAAEEYGRATTVTAARQKRYRRPRKPRLEPGTSPASDCHHYLRGGAMRRTRVMLLLGSTGAAVLVGMFVHR